MTKAEEIFKKDLNEQLSYYLKQRKSYGQYQSNLEFKRIKFVDFKNGYKPWEDFPIPPSFEIGFTVSALFNDMRQSFNPHEYCFFIRKVVGEFIIDHFTFDFLRSELIDSTKYPN